MYFKMTERKKGYSAQIQMIKRRRKRRNYHGHEEWELSVVDVDVDADVDAGDGVGVVYWSSRKGVIISKTSSFPVPSPLLLLLTRPTTRLNKFPTPRDGFLSS